MLKLTLPLFALLTILGTFPAAHADDDSFGGDEQMAMLRGKCVGQDLTFWNGLKGLARVAKASPVSMSMIVSNGLLGRRQAYVESYIRNDVTHKMRVELRARMEKGNCAEASRAFLGYLDLGNSSEIFMQLVFRKIVGGGWMPASQESTDLMVSCLADLTPVSQATDRWKEGQAAAVFVDNRARAITGQGTILDESLLSDIVAEVTADLMLKNPPKTCADTEVIMNKVIRNIIKVDGAIRKAVVYAGYPTI